MQSEHQRAQIGPQGENPTLGRGEVHSQLGRRKKLCGLGIGEMNGPLRVMMKDRVYSLGYQPLRNHDRNRRSPASDQQLQMSKQTLGIARKAPPSARNSSFMVGPRATCKGSRKPSLGDNPQRDLWALGGKSHSHLQTVYLASWCEVR